MSRQGTKSGQGDDYQRTIAIHWLIKLINESDINYIQAESNGVPGIDEPVSVDDIVVVYSNESRRHIQIKKNQSKEKYWSIANWTGELPKILEQLEQGSHIDVELYSGTPLGDMKRISDACKEYSDFSHFKKGVGKEVREALEELAERWDRTCENTFKLGKRLKCASSLNLEEWQRQNLLDLERIVTRPSEAFPILESFVNKHQSKLQAQKLIIHSKDVIEVLAQKGIIRVPKYSEEEILKQFQKTSSIGRSDWKRTVYGEKIIRSELDEIFDNIKDETSSILVTDRPGSGKTCLLLDLADELEKLDYGLLFIKGDRFTEVGKDGTELKDLGLPNNIVGLCARLAEFRRVIVVIDSLDVLSINRHHGALNFFLGWLDQLTTIPNLTIIAACRSFDLKYDPLLRDRKWDCTISLSNFDYDGIVSPLLKKWNVPEDRLNCDLQSLLCLPQNLSLFEKIVDKVNDYEIRSVHELHRAFLEEAVIKAPGLGQPALDSINNMVKRLLSEREYKFNASSSSIDEERLRKLISNGVLAQDEDAKLGFAHQTIFDTFVANAAISRGNTIEELILSHPPLPFFRPSVQSFLFCIRGLSLKQFRRHVRKVLSNSNIAYHFKRLIIETFADTHIYTEDWALVRWIFQNQSELFRILLWKVKNDSWFDILHKHWLPLLEYSIVHKEWRRLFLNRLDIWMNAYPSETIGVWQTALSEGWHEDLNLIWIIGRSLENFQHLDSPGIYELIETLANKNQVDPLSKVLSRYVETCDRGDELLWKHITRDIKFDETNPSQFLHSNKLYCSPHDFHNDNFFKKRLIKSELLLDSAVSAIQEWAKFRSRDYQDGFSNVFLSRSSWERKHSTSQIFPADGFTILLDSVEKAIHQHAETNTGWWQKREPELRNGREIVLRYFVVKAYRQRPEQNIQGIVAQLTNIKLLECDKLNHEIGRLINVAFPVMPSNIQKNCQEAILSIYGDKAWKDEASEWVCHTIYNYLIWIPVIFRTPESQSFYERFRPLFGNNLPSPRMYSSGGWISSPISPAQLLKLEDKQLFRLLSYYDKYAERSSHPADDLKGGKSTVLRTLQSAAAISPVRYLSLIDVFEKELSPEFFIEVLKGTADHLLYRYGKLRPNQNYKAVEPLPDGEGLAKTLVNIAEINSFVWTSKCVASRILEACCYVLADALSADRLIFLLYKLVKCPDPDPEKHGNTNYTNTTDIRSDTINSIRGTAAEAAMTLYNRLLEKNVEIPELGYPLLLHFALDSVISVRAALLDGLPYLTYKEHENGWKIFHYIFIDNQKHLWSLAERHLYHQYSQHFGKVKRALDRIYNEAANEAGKTWGRISALCMLAGHINQSDLFKQLEDMNSDSAWKGVLEVLIRNINKESYEACRQALEQALKTKKMNKQLFWGVKKAFSLKKKGRTLSKDFAYLFIKAIPDDKILSIDEFLDWIAYQATLDPVVALGVCEKLFLKLNSRQIYPSEPLIQALLAIMREADETDDQKLIERAVLLQDQCLQMELTGMEDFFYQASRL